MEYRNFIRLVGGLLLVVVVATAFHSSRMRIESDIDEIFLQAIEQDYQNRKSYLTRYTSSDVIHRNVSDYVLSPTANRKIGSYSIRTRSGITTYQFKDSIDEEVTKRLLNQHLLDRVCRLNPNHLKTFFQEHLKAKDMKVTAGVLCIRDAVCHWSDADSIVPNNAYSSPRQVLDIAGAIKVQAWVDYDGWMLFRNLDPVMYVFLLLLIGLLMWIWPSRQQVADENDSLSVRIDLEKQELAIDGVPCAIANLDLQLLNMLYERKGECITREEIKQKFWTTDDNAGEKIDTHIKTIRKILKNFPHYRVMTVRGKGYYLQIDSMDNL